MRAIIICAALAWRLLSLSTTTARADRALDIRLILHHARPIGGQSVGHDFPEGNTGNVVATVTAQYVTLRARDAALTLPILRHNLDRPLDNLPGQRKRRSTLQRTEIWAWYYYSATAELANTVNTLTSAMTNGHDGVWAPPSICQPQQWRDVRT